MNKIDSEQAGPEDPFPLPPPGPGDIITAPPPGIVRIDVPVAECPGDGYLSRHVQAQLDARQRIGLRRLLAGLQAAGARLANGRPIKSKVDAIRWLLDRIAAG